MLGTVNVPRPQLHCQTVALSIEQQQRVITGRFEMSVVGALLLLTVDGDLGAVQIEHHPSRGLRRFHPREQLPVDRGQPREVLVLGQQLRLERVHPGRQGRPTLPDLL